MSRGKPYGCCTLSLALNQSYYTSTQSIIPEGEERLAAAAAHPPLHAIWRCLQPCKGLVQCSASWRAGSTDPATHRKTKEDYQDSATLACMQRQHEVY